MIEPMHVAEIAALLLLAYIIGCGLGYGARYGVVSFLGRSAAQTVSAPIALPRAAPSAARRLAAAGSRDGPDPDGVGERLPRLATPRHGRADNLREIKGIGPKTESILHSLGIFHFDQIAAWGEAEIAWLDGRVATRGRILREQWIEQATLAATKTDMPV